MALADYWLCDVCSAKTFYDAELNYDKGDIRREDPRQMPYGAGDIACICRKCAETHVVVVMQRQDIEREAPTP